MSQYISRPSRLRNDRSDAQPARPRILCIDDDPNVSAGIARRLRPLDIDVLRAYSGMQGYWQMVTESPDVVLLDLAMPNGSGLELIECATRNKATMHIPLIVLTGSSSYSSASLFRMGISGLLRKPVTCDRLLWELGHHVDFGDRSLRMVAG